MPNIKKITDNIFNISLTVKPGSKQRKIFQDNEKLIVSLKSHPTKNKANKELINLIKKTLDVPNLDISIISGSKKKDKTIQLIFKEQTDPLNVILERLFKP